MIAGKCQALTHLDDVLSLDHMALGRRVHLDLEVGLGRVDAHANHALVLAPLNSARHAHELVHRAATRAALATLAARAATALRAAERQALEVRLARDLAGDLDSPRAHNDHAGVLHTRVGVQE